MCQSWLNVGRARVVVVDNCCLYLSEWCEGKLVVDPAGCSVQCADCGRPATSGHYRSSSDCSVQLSVSQSVRGLRAPLKCSNTTRDISTPRRQLDRVKTNIRRISWSLLRQDDKNTGEES